MFPAGGSAVFWLGVNSPLPPLCADDHGLQACKHLVDNSGDSHCQRCSQAAQTLEHRLAVCMHDSKFSAHIYALDIAGQIGHTGKMCSWFVGRHEQQHLGSFLIELGLLVHSLCTYLCHRFFSRKFAGHKLRRWTECIKYQIKRLYLRPRRRWE